MDIVIDFDGTCCVHAYPEIGRDIGAISVLNELIDNGHRLILFTMRDDKPGSRQCLTEAVQWLDERGINLYGIQRNPTQHKWTSSPKAYGHIIIDDAALGCPLIKPIDGKERPYVDWRKVRELLLEKNIL
jgi:hypothetical protein